MSRAARALTLLAILTALGAALAQDGKLSSISSGLVGFTVTAEDLAAAAACPGCTYVYPDPGTEIVFEVIRQNPNQIYTIDALHDGWSPASTLQLEARYTVTNRTGSSVLLSTPWLALGEVPTLVFTQASAQRDNRVLVEVEYRLALTGGEAAGTVATRMTHRVRESGDALSHDVSAGLPGFLTLRLLGATAGATTFTVAFDYGDDANAYLTALTIGSPVALTASDLVRAEISTNHPTGYTVTLTVDEVVGPAGSVDLRSRVLLGDTPADGRTFASSGPTNGFAVLFDGADYRLHVTGDETPGAYLFTVRLDAVRNP